jgi:hypothetical protein
MELFSGVQGVDARVIRAYMGTITKFSRSGAWRAQTPCNPSLHEVYTMYSGWISWGGLLVVFVLVARYERSQNHNATWYCKPKPYIDNFGKFIYQSHLPNPGVVFQYI